MVTKIDIKDSHRIDHSMDDNMIDSLIETASDYIIHAIDSNAKEGIIEDYKQFDWAYVKTRMLRDVVTSIDNTSQDIINFVIRYDQEFEIDKTMEVTWRGNNYPIIKVNVDSGMKEFNVLVCRSVNWLQM